MRILIGRRAFVAHVGDGTAEEAAQGKIVSYSWNDQRKEAPACKRLFRDMSDRTPQPTKKPAMNGTRTKAATATRSIVLTGLSIRVLSDELTL
jgi:hypothetical protein